MNKEFNRNKNFNKNLISELDKRLFKVRAGGGQTKIQKLHAKGKLTARERLELLFDDPQEVIEIGILAGYGMYEEHGGCPSGGVIVQMGKISNKLCVVVANDATIKSGAWFPISVKKNLRAQEIAIENKIPIIYLVDSAGVYLPLQGDIFADKEHFGRIFRNNAQMSSMGITQIAAIMGSCVAGGAYLPIMSDEAIMVDKTGSLFLAGSYLVKAAIGETVDNETLGGASTHSEISGVSDYMEQDDGMAILKIRSILSRIGEFPKASFNRIEAKPPKNDCTKIFGILPQSRTTPYDMTTIIEHLVDESIFEQYKKDYAKTILTGYARIEGWSVGIVANQRLVTKNKKGEMQIGGVIYNDAADKATRFIANCNQKRIPLLFLQDVTGFMVGSKSEHSGIIKDGAKLVNAVSNSVVPKFTVIIGNSYGAGNYAMCGKAYDPRFIVSWPTGKIAVMGGDQATKVLMQMAKGNKKNESESKKQFDKIKSNYETQASPYYAASRLWTDGIISPTETRKWISMGIEAANHNPEVKPFNMGLLQV